MLYHLLVPLAKDHILFNVFRYLTFRSVMALISALVISLLIGPPRIQKLKEWQHGGETVRASSTATFTDRSPENGQKPSLYLLTLRQSCLPGAPRPGSCL